MDAVLNPAATSVARNEGIARAEGLASEGWKQQALEGIRQLCNVKTEITSDDLWELLGEEFMGLANTSALGPVFLRAKRAGWIVSSGRYKDSNRPVTHGKQNRVWYTLKVMQ